MRSKIQNLRARTIIGLNINILPFDETYISATIKLRNQERAKYFLSQNYDITLEQQKEWINIYLASDDEVGFVIQDKKGNTVGVMFLYSYDGISIEIGRVAFDLAKIMGKPYIIEAAILILNLAFDYLNVKEVLATVKEDNPLIKFNQKFGFILSGIRVIRGSIYAEMTLSAENRKYRTYSKYVESWKTKTESLIE